MTEGEFFAFALGFRVGEVAPLYDRERYFIPGDSYEAGLEEGSKYHESYRESGVKIPPEVVFAAWNKWRESSYVRD